MLLSVTYPSGVLILKLSGRVSATCLTCKHVHGVSSQETQKDSVWLAAEHCVSVYSKQLPGRVCPTILCVKPSGCRSLRSQNEMLACLSPPLMVLGHCNYTQRSATQAKPFSLSLTCKAENWLIDARMCEPRDVYWVAFLCSKGKCYCVCVNMTYDRHVHTHSKTIKLFPPIHMQTTDTYTKKKNLKARILS